MAEKDLKIRISVITDEAEQHAKRLRDTLISIFNISVAPLTDFIKQLEQVYGQIQKIQNLIQQGKGGRGSDLTRQASAGMDQAVKQASAGMKQIEQEAKKTSSSIKTYFKDIEKSVIEYERALQRANKRLTAEGAFQLITGELSGKSAAESAKVFKAYYAQLEKEWKQASSYKTTPYQYEPVDRIKPFVEKQLPYKNELEKQLYAQASTAEKIIRMTQDRLRNGLLMGTADDVKAYMDKMLGLAKQVSPQLTREVARIFRESPEAVDMIKQYYRETKAAKKLSEIIDISPNTIKQWGLGADEIKRLAVAFGNLKTAISSVGVEKINKFYKDVISNTVVKGSGRELELNVIRESDIATLQRLKKDIPEISKAMAAMGIEVDKTHGKLGGILASARNYMKFQLGWFAGAGVIFSVVAGIKQLAGAAIEFQQILKNMKAVTGETDENINLIAKSAIRVSQATSISATKAAEMGLQLIRAGLDAKEAAASMEVAAKVTIVSGEDAKLVADTIATAFFAWRMGANDVEKAGNIIAATLNYSRLSVQDLGEAYNYFGAVAFAFNKSFSETNAILATFSNIGFRASTIATGMSQLLSELEAPTEKARKAIQSMGIKEEQIISVNKFSDVVRRFAEAGITAGQAMSIFEVRAGRMLAAAVALGADKFDEMTDKIEKSQQLTEGLDAAMEGTKNQIQRTMNALQAFAVKIGEYALPIVRMLAEAFTHTINVLTSWPVILAAVAYGVYKLIKTFESLKKIMLELKALWMAESLGKGGGFFSKIIAIFNKLPGWAKIVAITASALGVGTILDKLFGSNESIAQKHDELQKIQQDINNIISTSGLKELNKSVENTKKSIDEIKKGLDEWQVNIYDDEKMKRLKPEVQDLMNAIKPIQDIRQEVNKHIENITKLKDKYAELQNQMGDPSIWGGIKSIFKSLWQEIQQGAIESWRAVKKLINEFIASNPVLKGIAKLFSDAGKYWGGVLRRKDKQRLESEASDILNQIEREQKALKDAQQRLIDAGKQFNLGGLLKKAVESSTFKYEPIEKQIRLYEAAALALKQKRDSKEAEAYITNIFPLLREAAESFGSENERLAKAAEERKQILADWEKLFKEGMSWGEVEPEMVKIQKKYADFIDKMNDLLSKAKFKLPKADFSELEKQSNELLVHLRVAEIAETKLANLKLDDAKKSIETDRDIIGKPEETLANWEAAYRRIQDSVGKILPALQSLLVVSPEGMKQKLQEFIAWFEKAGKDATEKMDKAKLEIGQMFRDIQKDAIGEGLRLLPEGSLEKQIAEIDVAFKDKLMGFLSKLQKLGYIDMTRDILSITDSFEKAIKSGKAFEEALKDIAGAKFSDLTEEQKATLSLWYKNTTAVKQYKEELAKATAPIQERLDILNIEKENLQVLADANELLGNWNELYKNRIDLQKLEGQIRDAEFEKRIAQKEIEIKKAKEAGETYSYLEKELSLLEELREKYKEYNNEQIRRKELMATIGGAIKLALEEIEKTYGDMNTNIYNATMRLAQSMENAFMNFFDRTSKGFMKFGQLAISILNEIYKEILRVMIIKPLVNAIAGGIGNLLGRSTASTAMPSYDVSNAVIGKGTMFEMVFGASALKRHTGGYIPRFHFGGLAHDEVPAILQRGEYVVSRKGVAALDAINQGNIWQPEINVVINVQNNTGLPVQATEGGFRFDGKQMVKEIILELKRTDPSFNYELARGY